MSQSVLGHKEVLLAPHNPWTPRSQELSVLVLPLPSAGHDPLSSALNCPFQELDYSAGLPLFQDPS